VIYRLPVYACWPIVFILAVAGSNWLACHKSQGKDMPSSKTDLPGLHVRRTKERFFAPSTLHLFTSPKPQGMLLEKSKGDSVILSWPLTINGGACGRPIGRVNNRKSLAAGRQLRSELDQELLGSNSWLLDSEQILNTGKKANVGVCMWENGEYVGLRGAMNKVINALTSPPRGIPNRHIYSGG
jgi:hypothetical protein